MSRLPPDEQLFGRRIEVQCLSCGHAGSLASEDRRIGPDGLVGLTRRLICSHCGSRAVRAVESETPRAVLGKGGARSRDPVPPGPRPGFRPRPRRA